MHQKAGGNMFKMKASGLKKSQGGSLCNWQGYPEGMDNIKTKQPGSAWITFVANRLYPCR